MSLSPTSADRLASLRQARDRALAAPLDRAALDAFARAAAGLDEAMAVDGQLSAEARHEAGRVARGRYAELGRAIAAGRLDYRLTREDPAGGEDGDDGSGPPRLTLPDGSGFDAAGFVRRVADDWEAVAAVA